MSTYLLLPYFGIALIFVTAGIGVARYRVLDPELRILLIYILVDAIVSFLQAYIARVYHENNLWTTHILIPLEFGFMMWAFSRWLPSTGWQRSAVLSIPIFFVIWLLTVFTIENLRSFNTIAFPLKSLVLSFFAVSVLYFAFQDHQKPLYRQPRFWIPSGVLLYSAGDIMFTLFANQLLTLSPSTLRTMWIFRNIIAISGYCCYTIGYLCQRR